MRALNDLEYDMALHAELDNAFPEAEHEEIVEYKGKEYQRIFNPLSHENDNKSPMAFGKNWLSLSPKR